jgi:two-component sensor histidine kinase
MDPPENADSTILIVEDDEPSRYSTRRVFQQAGHKTLEAGTGEETLEIAARERPDLIILDVRLPGISGWEVCKRLKGDPRTAAIPVVHLSSTYVDVAYIAAGLEGGADAYLTQPIDSIVLVTTVRALLRARKAEQERERLRADIESQQERLLEAERAHAELARTLNREIGHRVKNNLAMAAGLLQTQIAGEPDPHVVNALQDTIARLFMFVEVHSQIEMTSGDEVELLDALRRVAGSIQGVFRKENVAVSVDGDKVIYPGTISTNLCVIANELMTNAIKHGGPGPDGQLRVRARLTLSDGRLQFTVWNSGNPIAADLDLNRQWSMGISLVQSLVVGQYQGIFTLEPQDGGTLARVEISDERLRQYVGVELAWKHDAPRR